VRTTQVFEWFSIFRRSVTPVEDAIYLGHQTTGKTDENVDKVKELPLLICSTRTDVKQSHHVDALHCP
jgi:hypothetical protein